MEGLVKTDIFLVSPGVFLMAVANRSVPVTADMNIKVPVNLKLQPRRHTHTLIFSSIHLMYLMIHFLCRKMKKIIVSEKIFSNSTFIHFLSVLQLQTN